MAHHYFCFDLLHATEKQIDAFVSPVEAIIPATECLNALMAMERMARKYNRIFCFDEAAYSISSNKIISNRLFARMGLPGPLPWPKAGFPLLLKPANSSGSKGVRIVINNKELEELLASEKIPSAELVMEEFLEGPSYSIEVAAVKGEGTALDVTLLQFDELFDCNRVIYPSGLDRAGVSFLGSMVLQLAKALQLTGIMDLEVIHTAGQFKVLEIDARLPSQTPAVVYHASGVNLVNCLLDAFLQGKISSQQQDLKKKKTVIYEHLYCRSGKILFPGEHIMAESSGLYLQENFFGADEAITNYAPGKQSWVATIIITADSIDETWQRRQIMLEKIIQQEGKGKKQLFLYL
jgi:pyrrolysine biosynthesis protein PylC